MEHGAVELGKLSSNEAFKKVNYFKTTYRTQLSHFWAKNVSNVYCVVTGQYNNLFNIIYNDCVNMVLITRITFFANC